MSKVSTSSHNQLSIIIDQKIRTRLDEIAQNTNRNISDIVRYFIEEQLANLDKVKDAEAEKLRLEQNQKISENTIKNISYIESRIKKTIKEGFEKGTEDIAKKLVNFSITESKKFYLLKKTLEPYYINNYGDDSFFRHEENARKDALTDLRNSDDYKYIVGSIYKELKRQQEYEDHMNAELDRIDKLIEEEEKRAKGIIQL